MPRITQSLPHNAIEYSSSKRNLHGSRYQGSEMQIAPIPFLSLLHFIAALHVSTCVNPSSTSERYPTLY